MDIYGGWWREVAFSESSDKHKNKDSAEHYSVIKLEIVLALCISVGFFLKSLG